jgi:MYXO-CTERM domain-containing protein
MHGAVALGVLVLALGMAPSARAAEPETPDADPNAAATDQAGTDPAGPPEPPKPPDPKKGPPRPDDGSCDCRSAGAGPSRQAPGTLALLAIGVLVVMRRRR